MAVGNNLTWTPDEVKDVAGRLRNLIWLILLQIISTLLFFATAAGRRGSPEADAATAGLAFVFLAARIVIAVCTIYGIYRMAKSLRKSTPVLYAVAALLPLLALIVLLLLNSEATRVLQANKIRVGVMGANSEDIERLCAQTNTLP